MDEVRKVRNLLRNVTWVLGRSVEQIKPDNVQDCLNRITNKIADLNRLKQQWENRKNAKNWGFERWTPPKNNHPVRENFTIVEDVRKIKTTFEGIKDLITKVGGIIQKLKDIFGKLQSFLGALNKIVSKINPLENAREQERKAKQAYEDAKNAARKVLDAITNHDHHVRCPGYLKRIGACE